MIKKLSFPVINDILIVFLIFSNVIGRFFPKFEIPIFVLCTLVYGILVSIVINNKERFSSWYKIAFLAGGFIWWANTLVAFVNRIMLL